MKKTYETPVAEKVEFCYEDQIVASGAASGNLVAGIDYSACELIDDVINNNRIGFNNTCLA